jgi:NAD(P)H-flavin reductase
MRNGSTVFRINLSCDVGCRSATEFNLDPNRKTLLLMAGGAGIGGIDQLAQRLLAMEWDFQVVALAGQSGQSMCYKNGHIIYSPHSFTFPLLESENSVIKIVQIRAAFFRLHHPRKKCDSLFSVDQIV